MSEVEHNGIYYDPHNEIVCDKLRLKEIIQENEQLKQQLSLTEKALDLACLYIFKNEFDESADKESCIKDMIDVFKTKAKELESE